MTAGWIGVGTGTSSGAGDDGGGDVNGAEIGFG